MLVIYNTLSGKEEEFKPLEEGKVKMYVCGATTYDDIHIGNARPLVVFDVVYRFLRYSGYDVTFVQNYTDIDDKIIARAAEKGISAKEHAEKYIAEIEKDAKALGVLPIFHPRVTQEMDGIIEMIGQLIEKGYAYEVDGSVFFAPHKFEGYGKLSGKNLEELEAGSRIEVDEKKRSPFDFVLWKPKKGDEPYWDSPWGQGRPGWHIECSLMAKKYLGETIDIHGGGSDLIFPHHENEIAQSESCNGKDFARYFMHNGFINIDNKKMSKSQGNFFLVKEIAAQYSYPLIRFFLLQAHYRKPINFSQELMEAARQSYNRLSNSYNKLREWLEKTPEGVPANPSLVGETGKARIDEYPSLLAIRQNFIKAMESDFNTPDAFTALFELSKCINVDLNEQSEREKIQAYFDFFTELNGVLGLSFETEKLLLEEEILQKIQERQTARKNKDFALADAIRQELLAKGIVLEDTREGVKYKRV